MKDLHSTAKKLIAFVMVAAMLGMFLPSGFFRPAEVSAAGKTVTSVSVKSKPTKLKYNVGDKLSTKGLKLTVRYKGGSKGTVSSGFTCSPTKLNKAGTQKITVKYKGKKTSFNVTVSKKVKSIKIKSKPAKLKYKTGETLSTKGLKLTVTYTDKSSKTVTDGFTCTPTKFTKTGTQKVTVKYGGKTTSFNVTVSKSSLPKLTNDNVAKVLEKQLYYYAGCKNRIVGKVYPEIYYYDDRNNTISTKYYHPDNNTISDLVYFRSKEFKTVTEFEKRLKEYIVMEDFQPCDWFFILQRNNQIYFGVEIGEATSLFKDSISVLNYKNGAYYISADTGTYYPNSTDKIKVINDGGKYKIVFKYDTSYQKPGGYKYDEGDFIMGYDKQ